MRILLTGSDGQVGWELERSLAPLGTVVPFDRIALDLADPDCIRARVREVTPALIVNAGAFTAVDRAEAEETAAYAVNAVGPGVLAEEAKRSKAWFVHYSTDYVFDGEKSDAYTEEDLPNPLNVYGRSKLAGEAAVAAVGGEHLVLRTSWVYASRRSNFLQTMLRLGAERAELRVVDDQHGAPTWARMIAEATALALVQIMRRQLEHTTVMGTYHLTCGGSTSWHGFAQAIFEAANVPKAPRVAAITSAEYPTPARRPRNSVLSNAKFEQVFGVRLPDWRAALAACLAV
jgi:dTDP-4-dehydrorhamnose reductase